VDGRVESDMSRRWWKIELVAGADVMCDGEPENHGDQNCDADAGRGFPCHIDSVVDHNRD
jgi:hypothetical protein